MKSYSSIPAWAGASTPPVFVFDKLDGSNVRCEINRKGVITKFGKRDGLLDDQTPFLAQARTLIPEKYSEALGRMVVDNRWESATFYFEFWGKNSSFGWHADEVHNVTLFDIDVYRKGLLEPRDFIRQCAYIDRAPLLYCGNFNSEIAEKVTNSTLENMTFEGIVAKGAFDCKTGRPLMFKWKSLAWLKKLKTKCGNNENLFNQMR